MVDTGVSCVQPFVLPRERLPAHRDLRQLSKQRRGRCRRDRVRDRRRNGEQPDTGLHRCRAPSGYLLVVDISNPAEPVPAAAPIDLGGQPDALKISPDHAFAAIAIESQRNEDLSVGGTLDGTEADEDDCIAGGGALGVLPQFPAGFLSVIRLVGPPAGWVPQEVDLTGLAAYGSSDPEPEFVDVNRRNEAVVTLQENNHVVVVDLATRTVKSHFPAGAVTLNDVDTVEDGVISLTDTLPNVLREPDAVTWVPGVGRNLVLRPGPILGALLAARGARRPAAAARYRG